MIHLDHLEQGSPEWLEARLGIPTSSYFDKIITPKDLKPSKSSKPYRNQLLAEWLIGFPIDWGGQTPWMERGQELEPEARAWYEMQRDCEVQRCGLILRDDEMAGGSPDGLIDAEGIIELKCPALHTHVGYLLDPASLVAEYRGQVQGYLYLTGRQWADVVAYNPSLPAVVQRVERDEKYITALDFALDDFIDDLLTARRQLAEHRIQPLVPA